MSTRCKPNFRTKAFISSDFQTDDPMGCSKRKCPPLFSCLCICLTQYDLLASMLYQTRPVSGRPVAPVEMIPTAPIGARRTTQEQLWGGFIQNLLYFRLRGTMHEVTPLLNVKGKTGSTVPSGLRRQTRRTEELSDSDLVFLTTGLLLNLGQEASTFLLLKGNFDVRSTLAWRKVLRNHGRWWHVFNLVYARRVEGFIMGLRLSRV